MLLLTASGSIPSPPVDNEAAAKERKKYAEQSLMRRATKREEIKKANSEMKKTLSQVKAVTDNDISDEAAGEYRAKRAAESSARRKAKAAELRTKNKEMKFRIANATSRTDDDVTDDVAADGTLGAGRSDAAAASKARKAAESARIRAENAAMRERIDNVQAQVDDDITDDVAADGTVGAGRAEAAAASRARKEAEATKLQAENIAMREHIATTAVRREL